MKPFFRDPRTGELLLTSGEVARILGLTRVRIHQLEQTGVLPCTRSNWNYRLFRRGDVYEVKRKRKAVEEAIADLRRTR